MSAGMGPAAGETWQPRFWVRVGPTPCGSSAVVRHLRRPLHTSDLEHRGCLTGPHAPSSVAEVCDRRQPHTPTGYFGGNGHRALGALAAHAAFIGQGIPGRRVARRTVARAAARDE